MAYSNPEPTAGSGRAVRQGIGELGGQGAVQRQPGGLPGQGVAGLGEGLTKG